PLPGADIGPLRPPLDMASSEMQKVVPEWTHLDREGNFRFDNAPSDTAFQFLVQSNGYELAHVQVRSGQSLIDVKLRRGGYWFSGPVYSKSRGGPAFAGTRIHLNGNGFDCFSSANAEGNFHFSGLPAG